MAVIARDADAFGTALRDHHEGRSVQALMLESDDGSLRVADLQAQDFFAPPDAWPPWERQAVTAAQGSVLDLGAGAGRHSLHLQDIGHAVTAVDASPGAVAVCSAQGIRDARLADLKELRTDERWDTIVLMGGNLGIGGDWEPSRHLLRRLAAVTTTGGCLIGDSVDPTSDDPDDLAYEARNRAAGLHRGHVRLRLRYGDLVTPWWNQLNVVPEEVERLVDGTGWTLAARSGDDEGFAVVLRRDP